MEESRPVSLRIGARADKGYVREENQDRIDRIQSPFGDIFVVADGMGGHEGGATAAQMLIDGLGEHLRTLPAGLPPDEALRQAASRVNADIHRHAHGDDPRLSKMGATTVLALIEGHRAWIGHAGDSRAYLWRGGQLQRLTRDHTLVQRMVDHKILNEEEARTHPDANVVTRAFGQKPEIELEVAEPLELLPGDRLLLCSDGLTGYVDDAAIARVLAAGGEAQAVTDALIQLALDAGGEDNVSVQLLAVPGEPPPGVAPAVTAAPLPPPAETREPRRGVSRLLLVTPLVLGAFLGGIYLSRDWLGPDSDPPPEREPVAATKEPAIPGDSPSPLPLFPEPEMESGETSTISPEPEPTLSEEGTSYGADPVIEPLEPAPQEEETLEIVVLGRIPQIDQRLRRLGAKLTSQNPDPYFKEGQVYYREGYRRKADEVVRLLGTPKYALAEWPKTNGFFPTADLLVAPRSGPTAAGDKKTPPEPPATPEARPQTPRLAILKPPQIELSEAEQKILQEYTEALPTPKPIEKGADGFPQEGHVYSRPDFNQVGGELAKKLGLTWKTWPATKVAQEYDKTDLLVVFGSTPLEESTTPPDPEERQ